MCLHLVPRVSVALLAPKHLHSGERFCLRGCGERRAEVEEESASWRMENSEESTEYKSGVGLRGTRCAESWRMEGRQGRTSQGV